MVTQRWDGNTLKSRDETEPLSLLNNIRKDKRVMDKPEDLDRFLKNVDKISE